MFSLVLVILFPINSLVYCFLVMIKSRGNLENLARVCFWFVLSRLFLRFDSGVVWFGIEVCGREHAILVLDGLGTGSGVQECSGRSGRRKTSFPIRCLRGGQPLRSPCCPLFCKRLSLPLPSPEAV